MLILRHITGDYSKMIKEAVDVPVIVVGGIRSKAVMEQMLDEEDMPIWYHFARPLICEPDLVAKKIKNGESEVAKCVSYNLCSDESGIKCNYDFD
ncbi:MAG: hypothetical protein R2741_00745 [Methanolobus sp.]